MRAVVTGATGFVGRRLCAAVTGDGAGDSPAVLSRSVEGARRALGGAVSAYAWEPEAGPPPLAVFRTADGRPVDAVFHLAGEAVAVGRWTDAKRARIRDSRVAGTRHLVAALEQLAARPRVLVCASAVGFYGSRGDEILDENAPPGDDFLATVCRDWEAEAGRARALGVRVVTVRIGVVLGEDGGAISRMRLPFRLGLGGRLGSGAQWMPWIHVDDVVGLLVHAATEESLDGPLNAVGPTPVTNRDFTRALGAALHRPTIFPIPGVALRLAFGDLAGVLLASQRVMPVAAQRTGYHFHYPTLEGAIAASLDRAAAPTK